MLDLPKRDISEEGFKTVLRLSSLMTRANLLGLALVWLNMADG